LTFGWLFPGDYDDRDAGDFLEPSQPLQDGQSVPLRSSRSAPGREIDIEDDEIGTFLSRGADDLRAVRCGDDLETVGFQLEFKRLQHGRIVVHHQNLSVPAQGRLRLAPG